MNESVFTSPQTKEVISYIRSEYGDELEFLWEKFDDNAIWRNPRNRKWYGLLLTVKRGKIDPAAGDKSEEKVEVLDLRFQAHEALDFVASNSNIFPGYHMNKNNWFTIILDGSLPIEKIKNLIDNSYQIAAEK